MASYIPWAARSALVEVNCDGFRGARGCSSSSARRGLQICSTTPRWVRREEASQADIDAEMAVYLVQAKEAEPEAVQRRSPRQLNKWLKENGLLGRNCQEPTTIEDLMSLERKGREKIDIRRFCPVPAGRAIDGKKSSADEGNPDARPRTSAFVEAERPALEPSRGWGSIFERLTCSR